MRTQALVEAVTRQLNQAAAGTPNLQYVLLAFKAPATQWLAWAHIAFAVFVAAGIWVPFFASRFSKHAGT
jgi:predicted membrane-bound mannosyltransferase